MKSSVEILRAVLFFPLLRMRPASASRLINPRLTLDIFSACETLIHERDSVWQASPPSPGPASSFPW